jgi:hypothetical protein
MVGHVPICHLDLENNETFVRLRLFQTIPFRRRRISSIGTYVVASHSYGCSTATATEGISRVAVVTMMTLKKNEENKKRDIVKFEI